MAQQVVKRDGTKEPFDEGKLKRAIEAAAAEGGLAPEVVVETVSQVFGVVMQYASTKDEVASSDLRDKALEELDRVAPAAADAWRKFDEKRGRV